MFRRALLLASLFLFAGSGLAQDLSNIQIHGFVTQGVLFSSNNNLFTMPTSNGSARWTDAALSLSDSISDKLHVGVQLHVYQLGELGGPNLEIDWATGDYRLSDRAGFVAGKVKTVYGLFNDSQDVDAVHPWVLLPESFYPVDNKTFNLAHYGADFYGSMSLGKHWGAISYRAYGGYKPLDLYGGYAKELAPDVGSSFTTGGSNLIGGDVRWRTPLKGLLIGMSALDTGLDGTAPTGSFHIPYFTQPDEYAEFERGKFMLAGEYKRTTAAFDLHLNNVDPLPPPFGPVIPLNVPSTFDERAWYAMASYRLTEKLQAGAYYSHDKNYGAGVSPTLSSNYSNDSVISGRYDFNSYFYAKLEGHFIRGTALNYYPDTNLGGEKTATSLLAAKIGFAF
jgi:hypothetical protein